MNLEQLLSALYPNAVPLFDFKVEKNEEGEEYISAWNLDEEKPTTESLQKRIKEEEAKKIATQRSKQLIELVKEVAIKHDEDLTREEADEMTIYFARYTATGNVPPLNQYPLVAGQVQEWTQKGYLPAL